MTIIVIAIITARITKLVVLFLLVGLTLFASGPGALRNPAVERLGADPAMYHRTFRGLGFRDKNQCVS